DDVRGDRRRRAARGRAGDVASPMWVFRRAGRVHCEFGSYRFPGNYRARHAQVVDDARVVAGREIFPDWAAHLRGHVDGAEYVLYANRNSRERPQPFAERDRRIHGGRLGECCGPVDMDPCFDLSVEALDLIETLLDEIS